MSTYRVQCLSFVHNLWNKNNMCRLPGHNKAMPSKIKLNDGTFTQHPSKWIHKIGKHINYSRNDCWDNICPSVRIRLTKACISTSMIHDIFKRNQMAVIVEMIISSPRAHNIMDMLIIIEMWRWWIPKTRGDTSAGRRLESGGTSVVHRRKEPRTQGFRRSQRRKPKLETRPRQHLQRRDARGSNDGRGEEDLPEKTVIIRQRCRVCSRGGTSGSNLQTHISCAFARPYSPHKASPNTMRKLSLKACRMRN